MLLACLAPSLRPGCCDTPPLSLTTPPACLSCTAVQEKIAQELDGLGLLAKPDGPMPRELELDDLKRIPYMAAVTKEAMRMLPVVSIMGR